MTKKRKCFDQKTYSLTLPASQRMYIMTSPANISGVLLRGLSRDSYDRDGPYFLLMRQFGISEDGIRALQTTPTPEFLATHQKYLEPNPHAKPAIDMAHVFVRKQLHPGAAYDEFETAFLSVVDKTLSEVLPNSNYSNRSPRQTTVSLLELVHTAIVGASVSAFFGPAFLTEINPDYVPNYNYFDDHVFAFLAKLPGFAGGSAGNKAVKILRDSVEGWLRLPKAERDNGGASYLTKTVEIEMGARGLGTEDIAGWLVIIHWGYVLPFPPLPNQE